MPRRSHKPVSASTQPTQRSWLVRPHESSSKTVSYFDLERQVTHEVTLDATLGSESTVRALQELPSWIGYIRLEQVARVFIRPQPQSWPVLKSVGLLRIATDAMVDAPLDDVTHIARWTCAVIAAGIAFNAYTNEPDRPSRQEIMAEPEVVHLRRRLPEAVERILRHHGIEGWALAANTCQLLSSYSMMMPESDPIEAIPDITTIAVLVSLDAQPTDGLTACHALVGWNAELRDRPLGDSSLSARRPDVWRRCIEQNFARLTNCLAYKRPLQPSDALVSTFALTYASSILAPIGASEDPGPLSSYRNDTAFLLDVVRHAFHVRPAPLADAYLRSPADRDPVASQIYKLQASCVVAILLYAVRHLHAMPASWAEEAISRGLNDLVAVQTRLLVDIPPLDITEEGGASLSAGRFPTDRDVLLLLLMLDQLTTLGERHPGVATALRRSVGRIARTILHPVVSREVDEGAVCETIVAIERKGVRLGPLIAIYEPSFRDVATVVWRLLVDRFASTGGESSRCWLEACPIADDADKPIKLMACSRCRVALFHSPACLAKCVVAAEAELTLSRAWAAEHKAICPLLATGRIDIERAR